MFQFNKKKIRKFSEMLASDKRPAEVNEVLRAIENSAPATARAAFKNKLRQELFVKHSMMAMQHEDKATGEKKSAKHSKHGKKTSIFGFSFGFPPIGFSQRTLSFATALLVILAVSGVISYPLIPTPQVEGYSLKENVREVSYNAPIKVVFSQLMDRGSVESSFHISPQVNGRFEWNNNTLLFYPEATFKVGDTFAVSVDKTAKSIFQKSMSYDYEENFAIAGPPQVILVNPAADTQDIDPTSKITVLFDRPMTALTSLENGSAKMPEIKIDPPAAGKFKWLGTSSITFIPDKLKYATKYTVVVPKGVVSLDGGKTDEDFVASFTTLRPAVIQTTPFDMDKYNGPDSNINIEFNQKMDLGKSKEYLHLYMYKSGEFKAFDQGGFNLLDKMTAEEWQEVPFEVRYSSIQDYKDKMKKFVDFSMTEDDYSGITNEYLESTLVMLPSAKLAYNSTFYVKVDAGMTGSEGTFNVEQAQGTLFKTVGEVKVDSTSLPNGLSPDSRNLNYAEVVFAHPMDEESAIASIKISPLKKDADTGKELTPAVNSVSDGLNFSIVYDFDPSTDYTLTVKAGVKDKFGQSLKEDYVVKFKTPQITPNFQVESRSGMSILDVNKPPVYYLKSTNVDTVNFKFKKLTSEEFHGIYARGYTTNADLFDSSSTSFIKKIAKDFNKEVVTKVDFSAETKGNLEPGIYYFEVTSPGIFVSNGNFGGGFNNGQEMVNNSKEGAKELVKIRQLFIITGTGLAIKWSSDELLVWATSFKTGAPVKNLEVKVLDKNGGEILKGNTDSSGLVSFKMPKATTEMDFYNNDYTVEAQGEGGYTISHTSWSEGVEPWAFNISYDYFQPDYYIYSYTDRPIYRPGDTVYFKGLVRKDVDASFKMPDSKKIHVAIKDSQYESVFDQDVTLNSNGTYNGNYTLGNQSRTGNYTVEVTIPGATGPEYLNKFYSYFRISEYRKPDYELTLKADRENYVDGNKAKIAVKGSYFFGAPLPNAEIKYTVRSQDYFFFLDPEKESPFASAWYSFSEEGYMCYWGCESQNEVVSSGTAKLNANGEYVLEVPLDISKKKVSQFYTVEVTAFDLNNQSVSNRVILPVHKGEFYTGILNQDYIANKGEPVKFDVISVDYEGNAVPGKKIEVSFYKRNWNTVKKKNVDSDFYYENSYDDQFVEKKSVTTDDKGHAEVSFTTADGGMFKATATSSDSVGHKIMASTTVYVASGDFVNWGRDNNDKIEIIADKNEYKLGDTAKLLVKSPYQNVWALVTQERKGILERKVIQIKSNSETIEIPITEKSIPNIFVSVLLVKGDSSGAGLSEPVAGTADERGVAAFKLGYATLQVNTSSKELKIDVSSDKQKYHPGDEVSLNVKTTDSTGKAVKAEVSVAIVDKSVLSLTDTFTADLLNAFYRKRLLGVLTSHTLTKAISRVNVQVEAGMKGGGGATAVKRGVFKDTAYWEANVNTNEAGEGVVKFKLPDNLTTWQTLAIGITSDTLVGSQKSEFLVSKDILIRAVLPRFLIVNDTLKVGGIVHNYLGNEMDFNVTLDATGVELAGGKTVRISLKPGEEKKVEWDITVKDAKEAVFNFSALAASDQTIGDILEQKVPVSPYSFPEVVATSGTIDDDKKHIENVWLPIGIDQTYGELKISVAPTLANSISQGLEYLMTFPYGCVEQTTSSLLPNIVIKQVLNFPALKNTLVDQNELKKNVEAGVAALYKYQQANGSFGIWQTSEPNAYLTAYVLYALNETKKAGYAVDDGVINRSRDYLVGYLNNHSLSLKDGGDVANAAGATIDPLLKAENKYQANIRAYSLYVLAEIGAADLSLSNNLFDYRDDLNIFAKAYLAMAYDSIRDRSGVDASVGNELNRKIVFLKDDILSKAKESVRGVHFEESENEYRLFDTNTRTTALVLQMLSRTQPDHPYIPKILRYLLMEKKDGRYVSTHETAITLLALIDYLKNSKELDASYNAILAINGTEKLNKDYKQSNIGDKDMLNIPLTDLQQNNFDNEITFAKNGVGKLYYDINLKYYLPTEKIAAREEGIVVMQEYFSVDDSKMENPINSVALGQNLKGKMTVIVPDDSYYVMVEDFLPAGLEGIDFTLKTSESDLMVQNAQNNISANVAKGGKGYYDNSAWAFNYNEVRDDRVMFFADYLPKGVYEIEYFVRATSTGKFHDLPALAQELYFPEVFGRSEGKIFEVK